MAGFAWTSDRVAAAVGTEASGVRPREYAGVSTDTRTIAKDELFVALSGESFDGTDFLSAAVDAGAAGAIADRKVSLPADFELFVVDDAEEALGRLARFRKRELDPTVVAITGTSGKTTTRELVAAALGADAVASPGNFNNLVGVPLSMLGASESAKTWVLELASNQPGEILRLGRIAEPDLAVVTSVSEAHLEGLGDLAGVLKEKLDLLETLRPDGQAVVSDEPPELGAAARQLTSSYVVVAGLSEHADERAEDCVQKDATVSWNLRGNAFELPGFGLHMVRNGILAAVAAYLLGVDPAQAAPRMRNVTLAPMRGEVRQVGDLTLLVDCYNANPSSFAAALESLQALSEKRKSAVIAGTMLELGERSPELHARVASWLADAPIDWIAASGEFAAAFAPLRDELGGRLVIAEDVDAAYAGLSERLNGGEVVLLKASRGVRLERVIPLFERDFGIRDDVAANGPGNG